MLTNRKVSHLFEIYAELLDLHNQNSKLSDWLSGASYRIGRMEDEIGKLKKSQLAEFFRPEIVTVLTQIEGGEIPALEELIQLTPPGLFEMMRVKGLGGKKLSIIWKQGKIDNVEDLLQAAKEGKLSTLPGFGKKTQENIIATIEAFNNTAQRFHYASVADIAESLVQSLRKALDEKEISLCGAIRRQATVVNEIEILAALPLSAFKPSALKRLITISEQSYDTTKAHTLDEIPVTIYHCKLEEYAITLFERTGSFEHVDQVHKLIKKEKRFLSEDSIYKAAELPFIPPELREDLVEWKWAIHQEPLLVPEDITGVVHNHTTWSDGVDKLEAFVTACQRKGYQYTVISDHSQNAHYAGGLKPEKVLRQFEEIDKLNKKVKPFKVFKSIECDILVSGDLDYDSQLLSQFDLVIISIHQLLKMDEKRATARLIKAIENPYTTILGHMTGRQLLVRPGYPVNFEKVIDACAANGVVIEVNANPYRLDADWSHIPYALEKGVMISINPDAHSVHEIDNIRWGVCAARKGGLTKAMTWNAQPLSFIKAWLQKKRNT